MAPTGSIIGDITVLATVSASNNVNDPITADMGIKYLWSESMIFLTMWGDINPINPIMPRKDTVTAVIIEDNTMPANIVLSTFTPRLFAVSLPVSIAL